MCPGSTTSGGHSATFSTQGFVDLTGEYFQAQGTNGRSCVSCHIPEEAWSINPGTLQRLFDETDGTHPVFNLLDANNPNMDVSTTGGAPGRVQHALESRRIPQGRALRAETRSGSLIAVDDPHGFANLTRLVHWRRVMPTINFPVGSATVNWDGGNSVRHRSARRARQPGHPQRDGRSAGPAGLPLVIADIVDFENSLSTAQLIVPGWGVSTRTARVVVPRRWCCVRRACKPLGRRRPRLRPAPPSALPVSRPTTKPKVKAREAQSERTGKKPRGAPPAPPTPGPRAQDLNGRGHR